MRTYEEIYQEIAEWDDELSDALDELCSLHIAEKTTPTLHELDESETEWLEVEYMEIQERIDAAEFWLNELEAELATLQAAEPALDDDELLEAVAIAEENALCELAEFGYIALLDDLEELEDFAIVDGYIHDLEALFDVGKIGGAEIYEYNELMAEFDELMERSWTA